MYIRYSYKSYKESKVATAVSLIGGIFNTIGKIIIVVLIIELFKVAVDLTKAEKSNLYSAVIFSLIASGVMFLMGWICNLIAKKVAFKEFQRMLALSYGEVEDLVYKKPKLKEWFMENHINYREIHENDIINFEIDNIKTEDPEVIKKKKKKLLKYYFIIIIAAVIVMGIVKGITCIVNKGDFNETSYLNDDSSLNNYKYQCYVQFSNDIVDCYEYSIDLYIKDKGVNEKIEDYNEENKVKITPISDRQYSNLERVRDTVNQKPKMDIDKDIIQLADATEKIYDLIGEIYYVYGGEEHIKETNKTKEELHKEFLLSIQEHEALYSNFSIEMDRLSIEYMGKLLEEYKNNEDMDSYYTLEIMIESQKIYEYFLENNITNENLFDMDLDEYNKILKAYNKKFEDFEKQDIKGDTHTSGFCEFTEAYHSFVNNIVNMVKEKNFDEGELDGPNGLVGSKEEDDIKERLYFYIDRIISEYNSIQGSKN